jgi:hypothetical protein
MHETRPVSTGCPPKSASSGLASNNASQSGETRWLHPEDAELPKGASYPPSLAASARRAASPLFHVRIKVGLG